MHLENEKPSDNVEDRRIQDDSGGDPGYARRAVNGDGPSLPLAGRSGLGWRTILLLAITYFAFKLAFGIDLIQMWNGSRGQLSPASTEAPITLPGGPIDVSDTGKAVGGVPSHDVRGDAGRDFVARVLGSTERVWAEIFKGMGRQYQNPKLVLFTGFVKSACGKAEASVGPFYCAMDHRIYVDLNFYQDLKNKLGDPGDFAEAYVIAHEVGHHVQNLLGITEEVTARRTRGTDEQSNMLLMRMELQADCLAGVWARDADKSGHILEAGDADAAVNAATLLGDDRIRNRPDGFLVPEAFTHGTGDQRARWLRTGLAAEKLEACDTFSADRP